jgi:mRNA interferase RelE/StbE
MATYDIEVSATAERQLRALEPSDQVRVVRAIQALAGDPRPRGCRKLQGFDDVYRIRVAHFRVIYSIADKVLRIIVLKVGHRRDVYR